LRALVVQHGEDGPGGHVSGWLAEHGISEDVHRIDLDGNPRAAGDHDLVVSLGSECSAYDDSVAWVSAELELLRDALAGDVPVLGICFGSQLLARALGGEAMPAPHAEIGWVGIRTREPSLIDAGPWLQWHYDTFTVPAEATLLAESRAGPQAYTAARSLGVQFHPEVTPEIVEAWVSADGEKLRQADVDPDRLLAQAREHADKYRMRTWRLMDAFMARVAGLSGSRSR
jgi:GMP synthase-like glutamine amidotransferase